MANKLKNCPHCGGEATIKRSYSNYQHCYFVFAKCLLCGAQGKIYSSLDRTEDDNKSAEIGAAAAWNMRTGA